MNKELNEKLAKWAGFTYNPATSGMWANWDAPDLGGSSYYPPNFTSSLDACFKWLVPKIFHKDTVLRHYSGTPSFECCIHKIGGEDFVAVEETPALALCKAIEELIGREEK